MGSFAYVGVDHAILDLPTTFPFNILGNALKVGARGVGHGGWVCLGSEGGALDGRGMVFQTPCTTFPLNILGIALKVWPIEGGFTVSNQVTSAGGGGRSLVDGSLNAG